MYDTADEAFEEADPVSAAAGDEEGSSSGVIDWVFQPFRMVLKRERKNCLTQSARPLKKETVSVPLLVTRNVLLFV